MRKRKIRSVVFMKGEVKKNLDGGVYHSEESRVDADGTFCEIS